MKNCLVLYSHCVIVKGISRTSICDLQRENVYLIPNQMAEMFIESRVINISEVQSALNEKNLEILRGYLKFLENNELAFYCSLDGVERFPSMSTEWLFPAHISNCIIDVNDSIAFFNKTFLTQLEELCCNFIQFRFFAIVPIHLLEYIFDLINDSQVKALEIIMPEQDYEDFYLRIGLLIDQNKKLTSLLVYSATDNHLSKDEKNSTGILVKTVNAINSAKHCGIIDSSFFAINIPHYTESLAHNTCLNRKISIDAEGNIKNCPSMQESYGNIKDTTLQEALNKPGFKKYWNITKDEITKCKDCEFRHICTDCRAYVEEPHNPYSAPLKCGYDPYTCQWEEWSDNPLKYAAIEFYGIKTN